MGTTSGNHWEPPCEPGYRSMPRSPGDPPGDSNEMGASTKARPRSTGLNSAVICGTGGPSPGGVGAGCAVRGSDSRSVGPFPAARYTKMLRSIRNRALTLLQVPTVAATVVGVPRSHAALVRLEELGQPGNTRVLRDDQCVSDARAGRWSRDTGCLSRDARAVSRSRAPLCKTFGAL